MRRVCAWCKKDMGTVSSKKEDVNLITHTICEHCANKFLAPNNPDFDTFLDNLQEPVLMVDNDVVALTANSKARDILGKDMPEIKGFKGGNIIECIHSHEPGGCGQTIHCSGCAIRNTVKDTYSTGNSHLRVPASTEIPVDGKPAKVDFLLSTQKVNGVVLLRIDKIGS